MSDPNATLLIVEDDRLTRTFLAEHLAADGYDPLAAGTLADARALLETSYPDLVLSDVMLPDGTGLDLIRHVRGGDGIVSRVDPATPVMLLSGRDGELDRIRGFERGCDDYLAKPSLALCVSVWPTNSGRQSASSPVRASARGTSVNSQRSAVTRSRPVTTPSASS